MSFVTAPGHGPVDRRIYADRLRGACSQPRRDGYKANTAEELKEALLKAKEETVTTLIEISVVPGTNTDGYESWWKVGVPEVSESEKVIAAHEEMKQNIEAVKPI